MIKRRMPAVHPGAVLKEMYLEPLDVSITQFADNIGVTRKTVSTLLNGHSGVSAEMAMRLGKALGTTPELWLTIQQQYELWQVANAKTLDLDGIKFLNCA